MAPASPFAFANEMAVFATMHGKERVVAPLLEGALGLRVRVPERFDTDRFGTFSREIARTGSQLDAARAKIAAAFELDPDARIGLASEGSFGPHPYIPFVPLGRELLVLIDRQTGFELIGHHASLSANSAHVVAASLAEAMAFAERIGFPGHGLIVMGADGERPAPEHLLVKTIETVDQLQWSVQSAIDRCGAAFVETDMRAHRNPTRMRAIKRATVDLETRDRRPGAPLLEPLPRVRPARVRDHRAADRLAVLLVRGTDQRPEGGGHGLRRLRSSDGTTGRGSDRRPRSMQRLQSVKLRSGSGTCNMRTAEGSDDVFETAQYRISWVLDHPGMSEWLKEAVRTALDRDPVAVLNDLEMLNTLLRLRAEAQIDALMPEPA